MAMAFIRIRQYIEYLYSSAEIWWIVHAFFMFKYQCIHGGIMQDYLLEMNMVDKRYVTDSQYSPHGIFGSCLPPSYDDQLDICHKFESFPFYTLGDNRSAIHGLLSIFRNLEISTLWMIWWANLVGFSIDVATRIVIMTLF